MNCKNCGAPLKSHLCNCEYCGAENENYQTIRIETYQRKVVPVGTRVLVDSLFAEKDPNGATEFVIGEMGRTIGQAIIPLLKVIRVYDPVAMSYRFEGRLDVLDRN